MTKALAPGLYGIADAGFGDPVEQGIQLADGGAEIIQLRAKHWTTAARTRAGLALVEHLRPRGVRVIMNDDLQAALASNADGLHLGQDDGDLMTARSKLGANAIVGRSTHSLAQAIEAATQADYIGFGPVFTTTTKRAAGTPRGLEVLEQVLRTVSLPVVAIGGIRLKHLPHLRRIGVRHWAVISDIMNEPDRVLRARRYRYVPATSTR
ncbi:MAG TPA: thiamine phosphate synthase [Deltaproteobacteria bacterium]|nr:thiamine phosphate synthase [Deltaproteobacteria bacterium]